MDKRRRKDIRGILADPDLRRELMVPTIQATQAREGIETTREQAERAYYVVTEGERAAFFSLKQFRGSNCQIDSRHEIFVRALSDVTVNVRFDVARRDFAAIEGAPLAFRRVGLVSHIFRDFLAMEPNWAVARQGKATADDSRWLRQCWEVWYQEGWQPFAKGGEFCRFYYDVDLVLDWKEDHREELKRSGNALPSKEYYFMPGLTWPLAAAAFNVRWLPAGCIFGHKGPVIFPQKENDIGYFAGILNSKLAEYLLQCLTSREGMGGRWEVGVIKRLPIPQPKLSNRQKISEMAKAIHDAKATWDEGNEICTRFYLPWLINEKFLGDLGALAVFSRLDKLNAHEVTEESRIQKLYAELNDEVYKLYGIPDSTRAIIEEDLGPRPPEVLWPQMEGKSAEQKRMEHVFRLLSYAVKRVVEADTDGIVPFAAMSGEPSLLERVQRELQALFPDHDIGQIEVEIANELKKNINGYRRTDGIGEWLENVFFDYHCSLYKRRPIFWHLASSQGTSRFAFGSLCHYHKFDRNRMAKLRGLYVKDAIDECRREAALAANDGRTGDRLEWQARLEEVQEFDSRLQLVQEGQLDGSEGGERDYRILTPWKSAIERPKGWDPDIDDGVKVNIEPLQKAGVLRITKAV